MKVSNSMGAPLLGALLSFSTVLGCNAEETVGFEDKAVSIDLVEPACAEPGSPAGYIEGNGFGALNVTITVGGVEAMVLAATGGEASFIIPEGLPPGPTEVIVTNPGGRIAQIEWVVCGDACTPTGPEECDGIDNDCNDLVDDGIADLVSGSDVGECQAEVQRCVDGAFAVVQEGVGPSDEACDGLDNDCSGTPDDGIEDLVTGTDVGECQQEIQSCVDGVFAILQPGVGPSEEVCDALDNDCNGVPDDGVPDLISGTDVGLCELEIQRCIDGTYALIQPGVGPMPEFCDGFDNNCNGLLDDGIADLIMGTDVGECVPEVQSCLNGAFVITQFGVGPSPESCDALDNDCNGAPDDGIADVVSGTDIGECQQEIQSCVGGTLAVIQPGTGPSPEQCDSLDNDCNGTADDGIDEIVSGTNVGECQTQIEQCVSGTITVVQTGIGPVPEECDSLDNDCNGTEDDGIADIVTGSDVGECQTGIDRCLGGTFVNVQTEIGPLLEQCDALDNDCNGTPDDGIADIITGIDTGECQPEIESCVNGAFVITQFEVGPSPEECDGLDNDCNEVADEGIADIVTGTNVGECQESIESCIGGTFTVVQAGVGPAVEQCDGLDNDCDGQNDDGIADIITGSVIGECQPEIQSCQGGALVITQSGIGPVAEVCDGLDNDCNAVTDDPPVCSPVNQPPILEDPGPFAVVVGSTLNFTLSAMDADMDRIMYAVRPLPLPNKASLNMNTGEFAFAPGFDEVGSYDLTFKASDGDLSDEVAVTIDVLPPAPGQMTEMRGRVVDTTDALQGLTTPVIGATIAILNTPFETLTDSEGFFVLSGIPSGSQVFDINPFTANPAPDGGPYAGFREEIVLIDSAINDHSRPFYLPRIAQESLVTVDPSQTTVVENATLGITMTVAPGTAKASNGANFTGQLSISPVPTNLAPAAMPPFLQPGLLITVQPVGVTFSTPAPITFPNIDNLTPGDLADLWSLDPDAGRFITVGKLEVSADGQWLNTIDGGIRAADWHFAAPGPPGVEPAAPGTAPDPGQCNNNSTVTLKTGNVMVDHDLVHFRSLSQRRARRLVYNSTSAEPRPIVSSTLRLPLLTTQPVSVTTTLRVGGTTTNAWVEPPSFDFPIRTSLQFDASGMPTGAYPYTFSGTGNYLVTSLGGPGVWFPPRTGIGFRVGGTLPVNNQIDSRFGAGWTLAELQQLHVQSTGNAVITEGDGTHLHYTLLGRSDMLLCRAPCGRFAGDDGEFIKNFPEDGRGINHNTVTFAPGGELWDVTQSAQQGGTPATSNVATLYRYGPDGGPPTTLTFPGVISELVATPAGSVYGIGDFAPPINGVAKVQRIAPDGTVEFLFSVNAPNCPGFPLSLTAAAPFDVSDPTKEEIYAIVVGNDGLQGIQRIDLTDPADPCKGQVGPRFSQIVSISKIEVAPDGTIYFFATHNADAFSTYQGIFRLTDTEVSVIVPLVNGNERLGSFALSPLDGLLYAYSQDGNAFRIRRYDPKTGDGFGTFADLPFNSTVSTFLFFPRETGETGVGINYGAPLGDYSSLVRNPNDTFTRTLKHGTKIEFDAQGRHVATIDRNGNTTAYAYEDVPDPNAPPKLISITDPPLAELVTRFDYDSNGRVTTITDPFGPGSQLTTTRGATTLDHDANGNLIRITDPDASFRDFEYNARHLMTRKYSKRGFPTDYEYNFAGRLVRRVGPEGDIRTFVPAETIALPDLASGQGADGLDPDSWLPRVKPSDVVAKFVDGDGVENRFVVNDFGQVTRASRGPESAPSFRQERQYDEAGDISASAWSGYPGRKYSRDARGNAVTSTDLATAGVLTTTYDAATNVPTSVTTPAGETTTTQVDSNGNVTAVVLPTGRRVELEYDVANGLPSLISDPATGFQATGVYDAFGNLASVTLAQNGKTRATTYTHAVDGQVSSITDSLGRVTTYDYDEMGRQVRVVQPGGPTIDYGFDQDVLVEIVPPGRPAHQFSYYPDDQLQRYIPPNIGEPLNNTLFSYTPGQRSSLVTWPDQDFFSSEYNGAGQLTRTTTQRGNTDIEYTAVDLGGDIGLGDGGRVRSLVGPESDTVVADYENGLLTARTWIGGVNGTVSQEIDTSGRISSHMVNATPLAAYTYDALGSPGSAGEFLMAWNPQTGELQSTTLRNLVDAWKYRPLEGLVGHTLSFGPSPLFSIVYDRDPLGRIVRAAEVVGPSTRTYDYLYDDAGRLSEVSEDGVVVRSYSYDESGNRTSFTDGATTLIGTYDVQDRIIRMGDTTFEHDAAGALARRVDESTGEQIDYTYDAHGNLLQVQLPNRIIEYSVDPGGRRIAKRVNGVRTQAFLYADQIKVVAELDEADTPVSLFVYGSASHVPDYMIRGGGVYRLLATQLGSVRLVVNADTGAIVQELEYDEFGNVQKDTNPGFQPFGFAGGLYDPDTGLVRFGARDFDASIGRWTTKDPIGLVDDPNVYAYVGNDPVNNQDIAGTLSECTIPNRQCKRNWTLICTAAGLACANLAKQFGPVAVARAAGCGALCAVVADETCFTRNQKCKECEEKNKADEEPDTCGAPTPPQSKPNCADAFPPPGLPPIPGGHAPNDSRPGLQ